MTVALVTGTRPEIIKLFPIMNEFDSRSIDYKYIHTGQHYDYNLFLKFIDEFGIRRPDISISADTSTPVTQVATIMNQLGNLFDQIRPSVVLIEGDTNSVLASALAALKSGIQIAHVESGLRSNDWKTIEEHNRRIVDHISDVLFSPTELSTANLEKENVHGKIYTVGNTVIDAINLCLHKNISENKNPNGTSGLSLVGLEEPVNFDSDVQRGDYILVTMHRSENVDDINVLKQIIGALTESNLKYIFPMHPHTMKRIEQYGLGSHLGNNIKVIKPAGYLDFLKLLKNCRFVITDSGGIQEEITSPSINKRALVLRDFTERPESVNSKHSVLCKIDQKVIISQTQMLASELLTSKPSKKASPYGAGEAARKITEVIEENYTL
jgi:UDP-N-acetylglucosamine 2-epimerase (non-hydrolysing)